MRGSRKNLLLTYADFLGCRGLTPGWFRTRCYGRQFRCEQAEARKLGAVQALPSRAAAEGQIWVGSFAMVATPANPEARNQKVVPDA
jgi:hypothetical protein